MQWIRVVFRKGSFIKHKLNRMNSEVHFVRAKDKQGNAVVKA